jgi:hypothetical protein
MAAALTIGAGVAVARGGSGKSLATGNSLGGSGNDSDGDEDRLDAPLGVEMEPDAWPTKLRASVCVPHATSTVAIATIGARAMRISGV